RRFEDLHELFPQPPIILDYNN
ncbi:MAG: hypothetical protein JWR69_2882, partial [Pedosphaera sp.]|nr:hypothetical protein [Pedosphaera sp.]